MGKSWHKKLHPVDNLNIPSLTLRRASWLCQRAEFRYQGKTRYFGTAYDTMEQAAYAVEIARGMLQATKNADLTDKETQKNVKLAKEVAIHALSALLEGGTMTESAKKETTNALSEFTRIPPQTESFLEDALLDIEIRRYECGVDCNGPKLVSSTSQPKKVRDSVFACRSVRSLLA